MTNTEKLAALIGEEGHETVLLRYDYAPCEEHEEKWPLTPYELIEIAEGRWKVKGYAIRTHSFISQSREVATCEYCLGGDDGYIPLEVSDIYGEGKTEQEARMKCAIKAMERLAREKEK